jgi:hypothetical protein
MQECTKVISIVLGLCGLGERKSDSSWWTKPYDISNIMNIIHLGPTLDFLFSYYLTC